MATLEDRKIGAIVGAAVADAAAQPIHWNYNLEKLDELLKEREDIEFRESSANPFYCIQTGKHTCYGDQAYALLESLVACQGFDVADLQKRMYKMFGPGSAYENKEMDAGVKPTLPVTGSWKHASIKHLLKQMEKGDPNTGMENDEQIDGATKMAPIAALYAGRPEMLEKAEAAIRVTQDSDMAVACGLAAARLLEYYILNGPSASTDGINAVIKQLEANDRHSPQELDRAIIMFLRGALEHKDKPHRETVTKVFVNS